MKSQVKAFTAETWGRRSISVSTGSEYHGKLLAKGAQECIARARFHTQRATKASIWNTFSVLGAPFGATYKSNMFHL